MIAASRKPAPRPRARSTSNPLTIKWNGGFALPPFDKIEVRHFKPALEAAFREHKAEIEKIATNRTASTFTNTIVALEKSGWQLSRVAAVFSNLEAADSTPELQQVAREMAPRFACHETRILLDKRLFKRIDDLFERRATLKLDDEDRRVPRTASSRIRSCWGPSVAGRKIARQGDQCAARDPRDAVHAERPQRRAVMASRPRR